uniref:GRAM domain-containing protein n=1 Tax=Mola mola TaxID=94237 RepID=A0A3Q3VVF9_MOLML
MTLPCPSAQTVSKYNSQYHKVFQCVPKDEILMKVYSCALLRDILLQGRLYISRNWMCFYANLFGKDIKVAIPVVSVRLVKKHKTAGLVPNGLAITTDTGQKYVFVSLLSRDSVYDVLRRICTHLQVRGHPHTPASCSLTHHRREVNQLISSPSPGQRQESELEAVHGGADLIDGHIILLILSSCYLAFRVCSLEQQLSFLNPNLPLRER